MSNKNQETIADIVREMRGPYYKIGKSNASLDKDMMGYMSFMADRIEAAKDAEIGKLRECLREAVEWSCGNPDENCKDCVAHGGDTPCKCETWRKMLEGGHK